MSRTPGCHAAGRQEHGCGDREHCAHAKRDVLASAGDLVLVTDADLSTPIEELDRLVQALEGCAVAVGSRYVAGARVEVAQRLDRRLLGRAFNLLIRALVLPGVRDTQCGAKLFRRDGAAPTRRAAAAVSPAGSLAI